MSVIKWLISLSAFLLLLVILYFYYAVEINNFSLRLIPPLSVTLRASGTGSMYPTFPKGIESEARGYFFTATPSAVYRLLFQTLSPGRTDILSFDNAAVHANSTASGFIKRIVGLPRDTIEIKDGEVLINGQPLSEPYTFQPRSTFGGKFLTDCQPLTIPDHKYFVMGDNRKGSLDSRDIGFVDVDDIDALIPPPLQTGKLDAHWRDTTHDLEESAKIKVNRSDYVRLLNSRRLSAGVKPLRYSSLLEKSAFLRGTVMLQYDDFSYAASRSGFTQEKALRQAGYTNPLRAESWRLGYYTADELIDNQFEFSDTSKFLLDPRYDDVGIAEVEGRLHGCPTQVIVFHFGGYVPPDYSAQVISGWDQALISIQNIAPGWASLKNNSQFYSTHKSDIDRINDIIAIRIANISSIVSSVHSNQWLTPEQDAYLQLDAALAQEQNSIVNRLNSR